MEKIQSMMFNSDEVSFIGFIRYGLSLISRTSAQHACSFKHPLMSRLIGNFGT